MKCAVMGNSHFYCCYCFYLRIRAGEEIVRNYDQRDASKKLDAVSKRVPGLSKYAHAVVFVVKANDPRLKDGKYKDTLQKIREHFREDGNNNIHQNSLVISQLKLELDCCLDNNYGGGLIKRSSLMVSVLDSGSSGPD